MIEASRRRLLLMLGAAAAGMPLAAARAADPAKLDLPKVDVHDPQAVALGYVENANQVDPKKHPQFVAGSNCDNCLQLQGKPGNDFRPCNLFPGKLVAVAGWCTGWTAEI
jgi:hypothetical protein